MTNNRDQEPNFHPISALPMIASLIDGQLRDNEDQYKTLQEGREKPHVLDDQILDRLERLYREQLDFYPIYAEQLRRWTRESLSSEETREVERLTAANDRNKEVCEAILALVAELRKGSIDRILEMDDLELGLRVLTGEIKPPR